MISRSTDIRGALRSRQRGFFLNPFRFGGGGGGGYTTDNLVYMLDAGNPGSYSGSGQTWSNIVASPADGSAQTAYDYYRGNNNGAEGVDPVFNGTAGTDPCYFSHTSQHFTLAGSAPTFLRSLHKSGAKFTIEIWCYYGIGESNINPFWDSGTSDQGGSDMSRGVVYADIGSFLNGGSKHVLRVKRDSGGASALSVASDAAIGTGAIHMLACSIDGTGAQSSFLYKDGAYDPVSSSNTFTGTYSSPGSADPANAPRFAARGDVAFVHTNGSRLYLVRLYNINLTKAQLDSNWEATRARFGL